MRLIKKFFFRGTGRSGDYWFIYGAICLGGGVLFVIHGMIILGIAVLIGGIICARQFVRSMRT